MQLILRSGLLAFFLSTALAAAGPAEVPRVVAERLTLNPGKCVIYGTALDGNAVPLPDMRVRLRNLQTRAIEQVSTTNLIGEFVFVAFPDIPYVVEIGDRSGRALVVSDVMVSRAGGAAGGVLVVPAKLRGYAALFRATAGAVASAVAATGLTLVQSPAPPLTPEK